MAHFLSHLFCYNKHVKNIYWLVIILIVIGLWYLVNPIGNRYVFISNQSPCIVETEEDVCEHTDYYVDTKTDERIEIKNFPVWVKYFSRIKTQEVF